jgi:hypothetical protein
MSTSKSQFISRVSDIVVHMATLEETCNGLSQVFLTRQYNSGGSDEITQADLDSAGAQLTVSQFNQVASVIGDYLSFCNNVTLAAAKRKEILNRARKDI